MTGNSFPKPPLGKNILLAAAVTLAVLTIPLLAMQFTAEVNWDGFDFMVAGVLLFATGMALILASRLVRGTRPRVTACALIALAFVYVWAELAVGIFFHFGS
ncbi:hypothetical protein [Massilia consociata]|uniref:Uncharacterized protein n=1 Tax=Massilia consociata TaxID=760117 RepID=A0ABV6FHZ6_9BURK